MIQPTLSVLTPEQIQRTHAYALQILAQTGVRVDSPAPGRSSPLQMAPRSMASESCSTHH